MSYSDFTFAMVRDGFGISLRDHELFDEIGDLLPSPWLRESLEIGMSMPIISEKARSEFIVAPILADCRERLERRVDVFSGTSMDVDPAAGLTGACDFVIARQVSKMEMQAPLMMIVEAKKHDIEDATGQCAAQMLGASRFNQKLKKTVPYIYGCITNVESWVFLKLHGSELLVHPRRLMLNEVSKISWFFVQCLRDLEQQASDAA